MDTTARLFALAHLLWPDGAWDVLLRAEGPRVTAAVHSADCAGDDEPMARVVADDGVSALDALAAKLAGFAIARAHDLLAATGARIDLPATERAADFAAQLGTAERALAEVTRECDAWATRYGVLAGLVHDLAAGRETFASDTAGLSCDLAAAVATLARRVDPQPAGGAVGVGAGVDLAALVAAFAERIETRVAGVVGRKLAAEFRIAADRLARQPDRGADEGHEPSERGAEVVR